MGNIFIKRLDKDDKKEGLFQRLKNIENAQKNQQQNNKIDTKSLNVFNYSKSLSQEAKDLIDEIGDGNDDIDDGQLLFIGNNKEKINFNTFRWLSL